MMKLLLDRGAKPNLRDKFGQSALHIAAFQTPVESLELLLMHGADPNARDTNGNSPLHLAARHGRIKHAMVLLNHGATPDARNYEGHTPMDEALEHRHDRFAGFLMQQSDPVVVGTLIQKPKAKSTSQPAFPCESMSTLEILAATLATELPRIKELLAELGRPSMHFKLLSKFYRQSLKLYEYQGHTQQMVHALARLAPEGRGFCTSFREIILAGTGRQFTLEDNDHWNDRAGAIVQAFLHARCFLEMAADSAQSIGHDGKCSAFRVSHLLNLFDCRYTLDIR